MNQNDLNGSPPARRKPVRSAASRERSRTLKLLLLIALVLALWALAIVGIVNLLKKDRTPQPVPAEVTTAAATPDETLPPEDTAPSTSAPDKNGLLFETKEVSASGIYRGDLILVNRDHAYRFEENRETKIISLYTFWREWPAYSYKLQSSELQLADFICTRMSEMFDAFLAETGDNSYLITSGWRSYEEQVETVAEMIAKYGSEEEAMKYTAPPGYSEHHTGMAFDTYIFVKDGDKTATYKPGAADMPPLYNWIYENCARFGFIKRYDEEKSGITGYSGESWHFRYVGKPHAALIAEKNFCLEEYLDFLREYTYRNYLEYTDPEGAKYAIYYEKVENETVVTPAVTDAAGTEVAPPVIGDRFPDRVALRLPQGVPCEISGDNVSGFIITVKLS